jgi:hypothetical protein
VNNYISPPLINQKFSFDLLATPMFQTDEQAIHRLFNKWQRELGSKKISPQMRAKLEVLKKEYIELYEWIKKTKENANPEIRNKTQEPLYCLHCASRRNETILQGFRNPLGLLLYKFRKNYAPSKIRKYGKR